VIATARGGTVFLLRVFTGTTGAVIVGTRFTIVGTWGTVCIRIGLARPTTVAYILTVGMVTFVGAGRAISIGIVIALPVRTLVNRTALPIGLTFRTIGSVLGYAGTGIFVTGTDLTFLVQAGAIPGLPGLALPAGALIRNRTIQTILTWTAIGLVP